MTDPAYPPDERTLLDAILADPDDDDRRLVYADWLEERGDPRAEWLRAEVNWKQTGHAGPWSPTARDSNQLGWLPRESYDLINRFEEWRERFALVGTRVEIVNTPGLRTIGDVSSGVLFVHAVWSQQSVTKLRALDRVLFEQDADENVRLLVIDIDEIESLEAFAGVHNGYLGGAGETYWIRDGRVVAVDLYGDPSGLEAHARQLIEGLLAKAPPVTRSTDH